MSDMGAMPGLDMLVIEAALFGVLGIESLTLLVLAFVVRASTPVGTKRSAGPFAAVPIGIVLPALTGVVAWIVTQREIHHPTGYHTAVDAVAASTTYLIATTVVGFVAALLFLGVSFARALRESAGASQQRGP